MISGRIDLSNVAALAIVIIAIVALLTDLARGRIYNWLTAPALVLGLVFSLALRGWSGVWDSFAGILVGLAIYGWLFWFGVLGGGDVKLLMAFGAWGGRHYVVEVAILGVLLGGAMALAILFVKGRLPGFVARMYRFLLTLFIKELELEAPKVDRQLTMPFGIPIAIGAICNVFFHPLEKMGLHLWQ